MESGSSAIHLLEMSIGMVMGGLEANGCGGITAVGNGMGIQRSDDDHSFLASGNFKSSSD